MVHQGRNGRHFHDFWQGLLQFIMAAGEGKRCMECSTLQWKGRRAPNNFGLGSVTPSVYNRQKQTSTEHFEITMKIIHLSAKQAAVRSRHLVLS